MLRAETVNPNDLSPSDESAWRALCAAEPAYASPLLGPDFARAVAEVRADARVAIWRRHDRAVGFLPHHRRPRAFARPIGAPLSDFHALVASEDLNVGEALALADLRAFRFTGLVDPQRRFESALGGLKEAHVIALQGSADEYLEALRAQSAKRFKNYRRLDHKLDREIGPLRIVAPDQSRAAFDTLLAWKADQLARTGAQDFLRPAWTGQLLSNLFELKTGDFRGLMINLYAGDRLVAGHFGVRLGTTYHPWIASLDPELAAWSPGQVFLPRAIAAMPGLDLRTYDLGPGHDHYKRPFALDTRSVAEGTARADGRAGLTVQASEWAWAMVGADRGGPLHRVRTRLDSIAAVELSLLGRARSVAVAALSRPRRAAEDAH